MKIVHIAPNSPYNEGWSYQENILPKYQMMLGHQVTLVITNKEHRDGALFEVQCSDRVTKDGFRVVRKKVIRSKIPVIGRALMKLDVYDFLCTEKPDFVFYHGLVSPTIFQVCRYKKRINPDCVIVQDNHLDYNIGFNPGSIKGYIFKLLYSNIFLFTRKYISKVYGVTPWREKYAQEFFGVPSSMTDVLIMGADDEKVHIENKKSVRAAIRNKYNVDETDFLIVTGAKIDLRKKIHLLMQAVNKTDGVKLLVFGNVLEDVKEEFTKEISDKAVWIGFISSDDAYDYFKAADLVVFPGQHSVFWEQACACKVPCAFGKWEGMDHVDNGGNSIFVDPVTVDSLLNTIVSLKWTPKYFEMKKAAESKKTDVFLYSEIAKKSLECARMKDGTSLFKK